MAASTKRPWAAREPARTNRQSQVRVEVVGAHDRWRMLWVPETRFGV
jgi:hypothetical protein